MTKQSPAHLRLAFQTAQIHPQAKIETDTTRVAAFFDAVLAEAPGLAREMSVLIATGDDCEFLFRARDDRRAAYRDTQLLRQEKTAFVYDDRICIYVGRDNRYEQIGTALETVLAHELGHWLDGAGHRDLDKWPGQRQRAECVADVFAALYRLRANPQDKQTVAAEMGRAVRVTGGDTQHHNYTVPTLARLLATAESLDLGNKTLHQLHDIASTIVARTYQARGRKPAGTTQSIP